MITLFEIIAVDALQESELNTCPASFCSYGSPDNEKKQQKKKPTNIFGWSRDD